MGGTHICTRDTGGKDNFLHTCCEFQPSFCYQSCGVSIKLKWVQSVAWSEFAILAKTVLAPFHTLTFTPELRGELSPYKLINNFLATQLGLFACFFYRCEENISHVANQRMSQV